MARSGWMLGLICAVQVLLMLQGQGICLGDPPQSTSPSVPGARIVQRTPSEHEVGSRRDALPEALPRQAGTTIQPSQTSDVDQKLGCD